MSFQGLPAEILLQVYKKIGKEDVSTCIAICKSWSIPAIQTYYEELTLSHDKIKSLRSMLFLDKENNGLMILIDNFYWVKKLKIDENLELDDEFDNDTTTTSDEIPAKFETEEFLSLLSYFTNLQVLDFGSSHFYNNYMVALRGLLDIQQCLTSIEEISKRSTYNDDESYFLTCYKFRHSLTHLTLSSFIHNYTIDGLSGDCSSFLPMFNKLTDLTVSVDMEHLTLFYFLDLCPNLTSINFINHFNDSKESDAVATMARQSNYSRRLKTLNLEIPSLKDPYLSYIVNYPPNYLETLHINMNDVDFYKWLNDCSIEALNILGKNMSLIKNLEIRTQLKEGSSTEEERVIQDAGSVTTAETNKMTRFYLFVGAIKGSRDLHCDAVYMQSESPEALIKVEEDRKLISFTYWIGYGDCSVSEEPFGGLTELKSLLPLPDSKITAIGPDMINSLNFTMCVMSISIPGQILEYILNYCTHLDKLEVL